jgi:hypothetical protein
MNAIKRQLGLMMSGALLVVGVWACAATRNSDGSWSFEFAPDMTITAWGLEDALDKLGDLLSDCLMGNFHRPCTEAEMTKINENYKEVLAAKRRMGKGDSSRPAGILPG